MHEDASRGELAAVPIEESFESLYDDAPCGYLSTLLDGTIVRVNNTMLQWTRYEREELVYKRKFQSLLTVGCQIFYETHYAPLLTMQGAVTELALDVVRSDRSSFPALVNSKLRCDEQGKRQLVRTMVFDATDRRSYERELLAARREAERAAKVKAEFVAMLSHDLRTPLTAILSTASVLAQSYVAPEHQRYLRLLKTGADSLLELVEAVLQSSKIESGRVTLDAASIDFPELVRETVERLRVKAEEKGLELWVQIDDRIPGALLGDTVKLRQILTNLVGNAIKFTNSGWVGVTVTLVPPVNATANVEVCVMDTGIGIDPSRIAEVFDEFTQLHDRGVGGYGGVGLGLAITKKLVELHGGNIVAENRPDGGSLFRFWLPLHVPA